MQCVPVPSDVTLDIANHSVKRKIIMKQTTYFLMEERKAFCLSCILNSTFVRLFLQSFSAKASSGWFRHFSWNVGLIPIPIDKITNLYEEIGKKYLEQSHLSNIKNCRSKTRESLVPVLVVRRPEKRKHRTACNNSPAISLCRIRYCLDHIQVDLIITP
jgi:hypothetical protein